MTKKDETKAHEVIIALLENFTQTSAAAALHKSPAYVRRWLARPEFQKLYLQARNDRYALIIARAQQGAQSNVQTLVEIMADKNAGPAARFRAVRSLLKHSNTFKYERVQANIDDLQASIEAREEGQREFTGDDIPPTFDPEAESSVLVKVERTARKTNASAAKISQIVQALLQHGSRAKAALACGISRATFWRWSKKPEFEEQYRKELNAAYLSGLAMVQYAAESSYAVMEQLKNDKTTPPSIRVQIADFILGFARAGADDHLHERVNALAARTVILNRDAHPKAA